MEWRIDRTWIAWALILPVWLAGCGAGAGGGAGGDGASGVEPTSRVVIALGPQSGGNIDFLRLDSLAVIPSGLVLPGEIRSIHDAPGSNRLVVLAGDSLLLLPRVGEGEAVKAEIPGLTDDVLVRPAGENLLLLDRGASRLYEIDPSLGNVALLRSFARRPEEIVYDRGSDRIVVVTRKGERGVVCALPRGVGESVTIDVDAVACCTGVGEAGLFYLATTGEEGARLRAYRVEDLARVIDVELEASPDAIAYPPGSGRVYLHYAADGLVVAHDIGDGRVVAEIPTETPGPGVLIPDESGGRVYLLATRDGRVTALSTETDRIVGRIEGQDGSATLIATPDSRRLVLRDRQGTRIRVYDGGNLQLLRVIMEDAPMAVALLGEPGPAAGPPEGWAALPPKRAAAESTGPAVPAAVAEPAFTLQIFSSDDPAASEAVLDRLIASGIPSFIEEASVKGGGNWYRVRAGGFSERQDAEAIGDYIRGLLALDFWVVTLNDPAAIERVGLEGLISGQDMDADGYPEIAVVGSDGVVRLFSLHGSLFVRRWSYALPPEQVLCGTITYADRNGDGVPEALLPLCPLEDRYVVKWDGAGFTGMMPM